MQHLCGICPQSNKGRTHIHSAKETTLSPALPEGPQTISLFLFPGITYIKERLLFFQTSGRNNKTIWGGGDFTISPLVEFDLVEFSIS